MKKNIGCIQSTISIIRQEQLQLSIMKILQKEDRSVLNVVPRLRFILDDHKSLKRKDG